MVILLHTVFCLINYCNFNFPLFCSSPQKYSKTSKVDHVVKPFDQTPVSTETTVYIDKIVTIEEVTKFDIERITGNSEVVCRHNMAYYFVLMQIEALKIICC